MDKRANPRQRRPVQSVRTVETPATDAEPTNPGESTEPGKRRRRRTAPAPSEEVTIKRNLDDADE